MSFLNNLTVLDGDELKLVAKLEQESGIDLELLKQGAKFKADGIVIKFHAYGKDFTVEFELKNDKLVHGEQLIPLDNYAKAVVIRKCIVYAMRSVKRADIDKQRKIHLSSSMEKLHNNIISDRVFRTNLERALKGEGNDY